MEQGTTGTTLTQGGTEGTKADGSQQSLGWRAGLPAELQNHEWLKGFPKVGEFAKAALGFKERAEKSVTPPGENATDAEKQAYYKALGVPSKEDEYALEVPKQPDGAESISAEFVADFKKISKNARLTKDQAAMVFKEITGKALSAVESQAKTKADEEAKQKAERDKTESALRAEWKGEGEFDKRVKEAGQMARLLGGDDLMKYLDSTGKGNDLLLVRAFAKAAELVRPDVLEKGGIAPKPDNSRPNVPLQYPWMREFYGTPSE